MYCKYKKFVNIFKSAASNGCVDCLKYIVDKERPSETDFNGVMRIVCERGHFEALKYIVSKGGNIKFDNHICIRRVACNGQEMMHFLAAIS